MIVSWDAITGAGVTYPRGFKAGSARCGMTSQGDDLALIACDTDAVAAGVFTTNLVQAPCVEHSRRVARAGAARAILVNAGNANACNGEEGVKDNRSLACWVGGALNAPAHQVMVASTGIIGRRMPTEKVEAAIPALVGSLASGKNADDAAARAIMTTDTRPKFLAFDARSDQWPEPIRFGGMCKGAGMIAPNMATMLAFLTTDAAMRGELLQEALARAVAPSFNSLTIDGDTSTNDMCLLLASGLIGEDLGMSRRGLDDFVSGLTRLCVSLAKRIAADGEGATKLIEIVVRGAPSTEHAHRIAKTVAESPLVKTALFGCDPNWGRLLMAAGRAGVPFDPDRIDACIGDHAVCVGGAGVPFDREAAQNYLSGTELRIILDLNGGTETATVWTCDLSYDYVKINAEYHT